MEKEQFEIFHKILTKLNDSGSLNELILIGSWCLPIYSKIYSGNTEIQMLRTKDIDFLVKNPRNIYKPINIDSVLQEIGFEPTFDTSSILKKYDMNGFDLEFLSARIRGNEKIIKIPQLSITAQVLDYMEIAVQYAMETEYIGIKLKIPELPAYVLHKAIVQTLRTNEVKKEKDAATVASLGRLIAELPDLQTRTIQIFNKFPKSWQKIVLKMVKIHSPELKEFFTRTLTH
ncbi:MAG: nucleotidyltransferase domain-containing protein [Fibromonadales bacterium]|nr:nucleotidyltransferase domain-containing protein [Fibromonadales bacterium]